MLTGGLGDDYFRFDTDAIGGSDTITGFDGTGLGGDQLVFVNFGLGLPTYLGEAEFSKIGTIEARFNGHGLDIDQDGDGITDFDITILGMTAATDLTIDDFRDGI